MERLAPIDVRRVHVADVSVLAPLAMRWFAGAYREKVPEDVLESYVAASFSPERIREEMAAGDTFLVAGRDGGMLGFASIRNEPMPGDTSAPALRIVRLYVETALIGTGLGAALMGECLSAARARERSPVWLRVWEHNTRAIAFYEKWGFTRRADVTFQMLGGENTDWIMALEQRG